MKTNVTLTRKMGEFDVLQRTSDGMFNATELLKQWNKSSGQQKKLDHYFENKATQEFINALMIEEKIDTRNSVYVKSRASRGSNSGTWMSPLLFIDFSMWLNPTFKVKVLKFVYDQLIKYRNDAGDAYIEMCSAISKITSRHITQDTIKKVARAINYIVYNDHERGMRNKAGEEIQTRELLEIERDITKLINKGFITNSDQLIGYLRKEWNQKWIPKVLQA